MAPPEKNVPSETDEPPFDSYVIFLATPGVCVTEFELEPSPMLLTARNFKVYEVPFVKPEITNGLVRTADSDQLTPSSVEYL